MWSKLVPVRFFEKKAGAWSWGSWSSHLEVRQKLGTANTSAGSPSSSAMVDATSPKEKMHVFHAAGESQSVTAGYGDPVKLEVVAPRHAPCRV